MRDQAPATGSTIDTDSELTWWRAATLLIRYWRMMIGLPLALAVVVGLFSLFAARKYASHTVFMPQVDASANPLAGLAMQFGFTLPRAEGVLSTPFYADLILSRPILESVVEQTYTFDGALAFQPGTLVQVFGSHCEGPEEQKECAIDALRKKIQVQLKPQAGTIESIVTTVSPTLSHQIAVEILRSINEWNKQKRQTQASAEREFVEGRVQQVEIELREQEDSLEEFLNSNRVFQGSPELRFAHDRLQRRLATRQEVYTTLVQAYEQARIDEVRGTPVITVVQQPTVPPRPVGRRLILKVFVSMVAGLLLALAIAWTRSYLASELLKKRSDYREFQVAVSHSFGRSSSRPEARERLE